MRQKHDIFLSQEVIHAEILDLWGALTHWTSGIAAKVHSPQHAVICIFGLKDFLTKKIIWSGSCLLLYI